MPADQVEITRDQGGRDMPAEKERVDVNCKCRGKCQHRNGRLPGLDILTDEMAGASAVVITCTGQVDRRKMAGA